MMLQNYPNFWFYPYIGLQAAGTRFRGGINSDFSSVPVNKVTHNAVISKVPRNPSSGQCKIQDDRQNAVSNL